MIFAFMGLADVIPFIVFGCFVFGVWAMLSMISQRNSRAQERLARLSRPGSMAEIDIGQAKKEEKYQGMMETANNVIPTRRGIRTSWTRIPRRLSPPRNDKS